MIPDIQKIFTHEDTRGTLNELGEWGSGRAVNVKWSSSNRGVVRGLHWQCGVSQQEKYISVISGKIFDVCLNLQTRAIFTFNINCGGGERLFVPAGYAHGFQALEDDTVVLYTSIPGYDEQSERAINPKIISQFGVEWPLDPLLSVKDSTAPTNLSVMSIY